MHLLPRRLVALLVALAVCTASGSHWVLLQSVAWVGMVAMYAQDRPLAEAVADTLDGEHPCGLCKAIASGKKREQEQKREGLPIGSDAKKLLLALVPAGRVPQPAAAAFAYARVNHLAAVRADAPPAPPPRAA